MQNGNGKNHERERQKHGRAAAFRRRSAGHENFVRGHRETEMRQSRTAVDFVAREHGHFRENVQGGSAEREREEQFRSAADGQGRAARSDHAQSGEDR